MNRDWVDMTTVLCAQSLAKAAAPGGRGSVAGVIVVELEGARVAFTERSDGSVGRTDPAVEVESPAEVAADRARVAGECGIAPENVLRGRQVHGPDVRVGRAGDPDDVEADGQATGDPAAAVCVHVADCLPVILAESSTVAALHGGWRGLHAGIVERGVAQLNDAANAQAVIGPGIGPCCFQVGDEVREAFAEFDAEVEDRIDLPLVAEKLLNAQGVTDVRHTRLCTACDPRFFSHRRDGSETGRQMALAWLTA